MKRLEETDLPDAVKARLGDMVAQIVERCQPQIVLLFGSWAEGRPGRDSDFDLLVVADTSEPNRLAGELMWDLSDRDRGVDVLLLTPAEFAHERELPGLVVYTAAQDGVLLYEQAA
jgi:predicted nucleotidyltransferase